MAIRNGSGNKVQKSILSTNNTHWKTLNVYFKTHFLLCNSVSFLDGRL